ncbi:MAG: VanZ family protein [Clostridia bacterium]|nr:VanZ family protein [Clostridia bacterium]
MKFKFSSLRFVRILLGLLILANMTAIFLFSAQNGEESDQTSGMVTRAVAQIIVKGFESLSPADQQAVIDRIHPPLRKIAHMAEFGSLGVLILLFLSTWKGRLLPRYFTSLVAVFLYACTDELHQSLTVGRGPQFTDVLIDLSGALICCTVLAALILIRKHRKRKERPSMKITSYTVPATVPGIDLRIAVTSDLHGTPSAPVLDALRRQKPDLILIPGDLTNGECLEAGDPVAYGYLRDCADIAPTFYSFGNHELGSYHKGKHWTHPTQKQLSTKVFQRIRDTGVTLLDNTCVEWKGLHICGLRSGLDGENNHPDPDALRHFSSLPGVKILLCHHPEYFMPHIKPTNVDLTVCGHAHGGQWRIFGRGVYAPGQGIFPKYTSGVLENRCVISRGLGNHTRIPRIFNPTELVMIHFCSVKE